MITPRFALWRASSSSRPTGSATAQTQGSGQSQALGGGAHAQLDESVSRHSHPMEQKGRELYRYVTSCLGAHYASRHWPIGIGSKLVELTYPLLIIPIPQS